MKKALIVLILLGLLLSGCASRKMAESIAPAEMPAVGAPAADREMEESYVKDQEYYGEGSDNSANSPSVERLVIKNAYLNIAVADPSKSMTDISKMAESLGGFVVSSNVYQTYRNGMTVPQGSIQIRVPAERLEEAMSRIKGMVVDVENGVITETVSGQDVTSDYVDSQSRLKNLEAAEAQLVELLDSAPDLQYTLEIFKELTSIRSEIEVLKGHIKYLQESAALSAISIDLVAEETLQPIEIGGWKPKGIAKDAIEALVKLLQGIGTALIWFGIYCLPFLIPLGVAAYFAIKAWRKRKARKLTHVVELQDESKQ